MSGDSEAKTGDRALSGGNRIPASELIELASRSSGPGGQHVNTSSTRVSLRWNVRESRGLKEKARLRLLARLKPRLSREGILIVHSDRHRSRQRNREAALDRLQELVELALYEPPERRPTGPSRGARNRRMDAKRQRGQLKNQRRLRGDD
jgi:ribosome-associated protein